MSVDIILWALAVILGLAYFGVRSARESKEKKNKRGR